MIFWSFFYLQVYLWIAGTALPEFKSIYDNSKNITSFLSFLEKNDGGSRSIRFFNGDSTHRGYHINVKFLPSQLVRRLFTLVCIVKKFEKILFCFFVSLCEKRLCLSWRMSSTRWTFRWRSRRQDKRQSLPPPMKMEETLQPLKKSLTKDMTKTRLEKVMGFENHIKQEYTIPTAPPPHKNRRTRLHLTLPLCTTLSPSNVYRQL